MTRNNDGKIKTKLIAVFTLVCLLFTCVLGLIACNEKTTVEDPTYSYSEKTDTDETNVNFSYKASDKALTDFPITSATGWSKAVDNSASSSVVTSGIVNVTEDGWKTLAKTLYSDSDFSNYVKSALGKSKSDIESAIKAEKGDDNYAPTEEDIANYVAANLFKSPATHFGASDEGKDDYVYMLNNVNSSAGFGTAQKITASTAITLNKGKAYKVSVWVKTANISCNNPNEYGANIRLIPSFNGTTQAEYRISNIRDTEWTEYTIYVLPDEDYTCKFTLVLGLGYGNGSSADGKYYVEGTAFFDDIKYEEVELADVPTTTPDKMQYAVKDCTEATLTDKVCVYDMSFANSIVFDTYATPCEEGKFTESKIEKEGSAITSKTDNPNSTATKADDAGIRTYTLNQASYSVKLINNAVIGPESYFFISFDILNGLETTGSTEITLNLYDINGSVNEKRAGIASFSTPSEDWQKAEIMVKNNFETGDREFYLELVIGPSDPSAVQYNSDFATGTVSVKNIKSYVDSTDSEVYAEGADDPTYKIYQFFGSVADATNALYAGYTADYIEDDDSDPTYPLSIAPANIGCIENEPTNVKGFDGVTANHVYLKANVNDGETLETAINVRSGKAGDGNGNFAGLINSEYLGVYHTNTGLDIGAELEGAFNDEIQPLMIYNKAKDSYGYIGSANSLAASGYAKVAVTLRVTGEAKAYVYIVNTLDKKVMEFNAFTDVNGNEQPAKQLLLTASKDMMGEDGWVTLSFYVAAGANEKSFRVEVWNGGRDGAEENKSLGFVFVKDIAITASGAFTEPEIASNAFSVAGNPLFDIKKTNLTELSSYKRPLTATEEQFNKEYPEQAVNYSATYVWAKGNTDIYAVFNTVDPVITDPYANITEEEDESGCAAKADPSTFWLSFSSILLGVVLVLAILALVFKTINRRRKANKSDAKVRYQVKSRISTHNENKKRLESTKKSEGKEQIEEAVEEQPTEEVVEQSENEGEQPASEENLDSYVYGEVQDFGETETNESAPENSEEKKED